MKYLYSNCIASYVFDDNFRLIEQVSLQNAAALEMNEWLEEEKSLLKKHKGQLIFLGFKKEALARTLQDVRKLDAITSKEDFTKYKEKITAVTKAKISEEFSKDQLIMQVSSQIEELGKVINILVKRLREWYGIYSPSVSKTADNEKLVNIIVERKEISDIMGARQDRKDLTQIESIANEAKRVYALKKAQEEYLEKLMQEICPNLKALAGSAIGAKLIALAGSLKKLMELPASTIQVLGAERALFRHLKNPSQRMPKYGVLFQHQLVTNAKKDARGKAARALADKIAIAIKVDYFKGQFVGDALLQGLEKRFK
ncbi:hypothetical protein JXB11_02185 [Candidatus Woesearchaeota archaeon]|nr:hypothetical protein [Candidatus Woesearchaeota archaeon]